MHGAFKVLKYFTHTRFSNPIEWPLTVVRKNTVKCENVSKIKVS